MRPCFPPVAGLLARRKDICRAWQSGSEHPFLIDNVRDLCALLDYLTSRPDVDASRIGMTGVSLGGMHTWLCAALDRRVAAAAPMIGVQGFGWAVEHDHFQGRVDSLRAAFASICAAEGKARVPHLLRYPLDHW